jgi:hypothetical protein
VRGGGRGSRGRLDALLILLYGRTWHPDALVSEMLAEDDEALTDLGVGTPDRDMALVRRSILHDEGRDTSARDVGDLFKAAALSPNYVTDNSVRNDDGHLVEGAILRRVVLCEGERQGSGGDSTRLALGGLSAFALRLRALLRSRGRSRASRLANRLLLSRWVASGRGSAVNPLPQSGDFFAQRTDRRG